jgi:hypothetical protein
VTLADVQKFRGSGLLAWVRSVFEVLELPAPSAESASALLSRNGLILVDTLKETKSELLAPLLRSDFKLSEVQALSLAASLRDLAAQSAQPAARTGALKEFPVYFSAVRYTNLICCHLLR